MIISKDSLSTGTETLRHSVNAEFGSGGSHRAELQASAVPPPSFFDRGVGFVDQRVTTSPATSLRQDRYWPLPSSPRRPKPPPPSRQKAFLVLRLDGRGGRGRASGAIRRGSERPCTTFSSVGSQMVVPSSTPPGILLGLDRRYRPTATATRSSPGRRPARLYWRLWGSAAATPEQFVLTPQASRAGPVRLPTRPGACWRRRQLLFRRGRPRRQVGLVDHRP